MSSSDTFHILLITVSYLNVRANSLIYCNRDYGLFQGRSFHNEPSIFVNYNVAYSRGENGRSRFFDNILLYFQTRTVFVYYNDHITKFRYNRPNLFFTCLFWFDPNDPLMWITGNACSTDSFFPPFRSGKRKLPSRNISNVFRKYLLRVY